MDSELFCNRSEEIFRPCVKNVFSVDETNCISLCIFEIDFGKMLVLHGKLRDEG